MKRIIVHKSTGNQKEKWSVRTKYNDIYVQPVLKDEVVETEVEFISLNNEVIYKSESYTGDGLTKKEEELLKEHGM